MSLPKLSGGVAGPRWRREALKRQRGVALIIALILVALAAILATKLSFDGWLERRRAIGVIAAEQALQFGIGAEALAADVLLSSKVQATNGSAARLPLPQPWAQPTQPLPITPENDPEGEPIGTVQGAIEDMQGRFNLNNLARMSMRTGKQDPQPLEQFQRLLVAVGLGAEVGRHRPRLDRCGRSARQSGRRGRFGLYEPNSALPNRQLADAQPERIDELPGFGADRYRKIAPYVTALPTALAKINICTAPRRCCESLADNLNGEYSGSPEVLVNGRKAGCFPDKTAFTNILGRTSGKSRPALRRHRAAYFRLTTRVTLGTTQFTLYSLLFRNPNGGGKVTPLLRTFGTL